LCNLTAKAMEEQIIQLESFNSACVSRVVWDCCYANVRALHNWCQVSLGPNK
jgi:hypothetical protein